ncbi:hypothetical protein PR202_ga10269 [Eleusine coracana subsp. coracana]|uniref:C2H2-type domain-containing protein n=1 Tax=Eleusine coracana subsp. coracana TaxID=191504 RepID=A0AAV5C689_ELECO|nr:hypothetical protein QOZ80_1AG0027100 [Eleusine coracana subsp. coracana]GJM93687.1 hypothetical protein PR202_ga10269 [Eleusine coracana subsp. coracana]
MSTGSSEDQRRRRRRLVADELEDGECSPGGGYQSSSDTEDYYNRGAALSGGGGGGSEETVSDDLDATASSAAARASTASSVLAGLYGSGGAYSRPSFAAASYYGRAHASAAASHYYGRASASSAAAPVFPCRMCGKEFGSEKAGHMKVHALEALHGGSNYEGNGISKEKKAMKKRKVEVAAGWGVTGRRGCAGLGTSVVDIVKGSPIAARDTLPAAHADPELVYQPTPISCAMPEGSSSAMPEESSSASMASARTSLSDESSGKKPVIGMDIAEAAGADTPSPIPPPTEPVVVHQQVQLQSQPAPPPPPPAGQKQAARRARRGPGAAPHPGRQNPAGYRCRDPACGMWFSSHQALGGHVAAHKQNIKRAAAAMHQDGGAGGGPKPEEAKRHRCGKCNAEFAMGVQLGGHMRKHWVGDPIVPKRKPQRQKPLLQPLPPPAVHAADLMFAPPIKEESRSLAPAVDAAEGTHEPATSGPDGTGRAILLFGIDIGLGVKTPPAREGSPATKDSSSPSTGEQQQ